MRHIISFVFLLLTLPVAAQRLEDELVRLDKTIEMASDYVNAHESQTSSIRKLLENHSLNARETYDICDQLYKLEYTYSFDRAMNALDMKMEAARKLKDNSCISETNVQKATLLCIAGLYLESMQAASQIDTTCLSPAQLIEYYNFQQRFNSDYLETNPNEGDRSSMLEKVHFYRRKIIEETSDSDFINSLMMVREMLDEGRLEQADTLSLIVLGKLGTGSHEYAELAYWEGTVCRGLGRWEDMMMWFARSAIGDIKSATKDNASLQSLAIEFLQADRDIERAFKYTQLSLKDALVFNARLRPWQIAQNLPAIEATYNSAREVQEKRARALLTDLFILALVLLFALVLLIILYIRHRFTERKIKEVNLQLKSAMENLSKANAAKEEYIGLFLSMCSSYIDKLRKYLSMSQIDDELKNFYKAFDNAFLQLYPDFVEKFNALLVPEARVELKKDELLNTELRIFAVIKLGITQSSHIAALLRYSVNTIYNYRAQIKNAAIDGKDSFEERVKAI